MSLVRPVGALEQNMYMYMFVRFSPLHRGVILLCSQICKDATETSWQSWYHLQTSPKTLVGGRRVKRRTPSCSRESSFRKGVIIVCRPQMIL